MNLMGKKNLFTDAKKKIFTDANLRKQQKEQHTQVSLCVLCTKLYTKGTVYSSVKTMAVTSSREVDKIGPK